MAREFRVIDDEIWLGNRCALQCQRNVRMKKLALIFALAFATTPAFARGGGHGGGGHGGFHGGGIHTGRSVGGNVYRGGYRHVYGGRGYGYGYNGYGYNGCYGNYNGYCGGNPGAAIGLGILGGVLEAASRNQSLTRTS